MNKSLISFHKACKPEYIQLVEEFNILFYGFGDKLSLIKHFYTNSITLNCQDDQRTFIRKLRTKVLNQEYENLNDYDYFTKINTNKVLILKNFNIDQIQFLRLNRFIKFVGLIDTKDLGLNVEQLDSFNIILRDLTTFVPYRVSDEVLKLEQSGVSNCVLVARSVPDKSLKVFLMFLAEKRKKKKVLAEEFCDIVVKEFMVRKNKAMDYLNEFFENNILKLRGEEIVIKLSYSEIESVCNILTNN